MTITTPDGWTIEIDEQSPAEVSGEVCAHLWCAYYGAYHSAQHARREMETARRILVACPRIRGERDQLIYDLNVTALIDRADVELLKRHALATALLAGRVARETAKGDRDG